MGLNIQNLSRPNGETNKKLQLAIELVRKMDLSGLISNFKLDPLTVIGDLTRSVFIASPGNKLLICDLSAIENRGLGWIARDKTIIDIFEEGKDPYLAFACILYNQKYKDLEARYKAGDPEAKLMRQNAKPAVLGAGYMLSPGEEKLTANGDKILTGLRGYAKNMGINLAEELAKRSIDAFRSRHKGVVRCWYDLENAALDCIATRQPQTVGYVKFEIVENVLCIWLPSGRALHYVDPDIVKIDFFGKMKNSIECLGMDQKTHQFTRIYTYGGKLIENIVQAISRDILASGMIEATNIGIPIVMHTHDEIVGDVPENGHLGIEDLRQCMIKLPKWADSKLILDASGFESKIYRKE